MAEASPLDAAIHRTRNVGGRGHSPLAEPERQTGGTEFLSEESQPALALTCASVIGPLGCSQGRPSLTPLGPLAFTRLLSVVVGGRPNEKRWGGGGGESAFLTGDSGNSALRENQADGFAPE